MAWSVVAVVALADLALSPGTRRAAVTARAPAELFTGESGDIVVAVSGWRGGTRNRLRGRIAYPVGLDGPGEAPFAEAGAIAELRLRVTARRRGVWPVDRLWLNWSSRFGLIEYSHRASLDIEIMVSPNIRRVRSGEIDVAVRSALYGTKENILVGEGSEFHQLRDFSRGMDPRSIDWKRSARHRSSSARRCAPSAITASSWHSTTAISCARRLPGCRRSITTSRRCSHLPGPGSSAATASGFCLRRAPAGVRAAGGWARRLHQAQGRGGAARIPERGDQFHARHGASP